MLVAISCLIVCVIGIGGYIGYSIWDFEHSGFEISLDDRK